VEWKHIDFSQDVNIGARRSFILLDIFITVRKASFQEWTGSLLIPITGCRLKLVTLYANPWPWWKQGKKAAHKAPGFLFMKNMNISVSNHIDFRYQMTLICLIKNEEVISSADIRRYRKPDIQLNFKMVLKSGIERTSWRWYEGRI